MGDADDYATFQCGLMVNGLASIKTLAVRGDATVRNLRVLGTLSGAGSPQTCRALTLAACSRHA